MDRRLNINFDSGPSASLRILTDDTVEEIRIKIKDILSGPSEGCRDALKCGVCFGQYGPVPRRPTTFPCGHSICMECMWNLNVPLCPECRAPIVKAIQQPAVSLMQVAEACGGHNFDGGKRRRRRRTTKNRSASRRRRNSRRARR